MAVGDTVVTVVGNLTADPELKVGPQGVPVVSFTVASSRRVRNPETGEWADAGTLFLRCSAFRQLAENCAESLARGCRAVVTGRLKQRSYVDREGVRRTVFEIEADDVGPSLRWTTAKVVRARPEEAAQRPMAA